MIFLSGFPHPWPAPPHPPKGSWGYRPHCLLCSCQSHRHQRFPLCPTLQSFWSCSLTPPSHRRPSLSPLKRQSLPERSLVFSGGPEHREERKPLFGQLFRPARPKDRHSTTPTPSRGRPAEGCAPAGPRSGGTSPEPRSRPGRGPTSDIHSRHGRHGLPRTSGGGQEAPGAGGAGRDGTGGRPSALARETPS